MSWTIFAFTFVLFLAMRWPKDLITWPAVALVVVNLSALVVLVVLAAWLHAGAPL